MKAQQQTQASTSSHGAPDLYERLWHYATARANSLDAQVSNTVETLLRLHLDPEAFAVLARFHREFDEHCGHVGLLFLDSLNELGGTGGVAQLQRTLRRIKKEQETV